jgi:hypothetical protein
MIRKQPVFPRDANRALRQDMLLECPNTMAIFVKAISGHGSA